MPIFFLLLLALAHMRPHWPEPWFGTSGDCAFMVFAGCLLFVGAAAMVTARFRKRISQNPSDLLPALYWFQRRKEIHFYAFFFFIVFAAYYLGWGWAVQELYEHSAISLDAKPATDLRPPRPGFEILFLSPLLMGLVLSWMFYYDGERQAHDLRNPHETYPRRGSYVLFQARHQFILMTPPLILILAEGCLAWLLPQGENSQWVLLLAGLLILLFFIGLPWILRIFLGLQPLPEGPLRDRLVATGKRMNLRFNDILLWKTRNTMANAMVTGVFPWLRYVVITDRLIADLPPEEIEAVFGHEVGHIKHHHIAFYMLFLFLSILVFSTVWEISIKPLASISGSWGWIFSTLKDSPEIAILLGVLYIFIVFGFLSRRCERQADIFGAEVASPDAFIQALEKVAQINGIPRENPGFLSSWQHSTIALRIDFIRRASEDGRLVPRFQRRFGALKWGLSLGLIAAALLLKMGFDGFALGG